MTRQLLEQIVKSKKELQGLPVIGNVDFGHTTPMITFPIGGSARLHARSGEVKLEIIRH